MSQIGTPEKFIEVIPAFEPVPMKPSVNEPAPQIPQEQPEEVPSGRI